MVGRKGFTAKAPSKTTALSGQRDLFHFYQKQPRFKDGGTATTTSGMGTAASVYSDGAGSQPLGLKEDMYTEVSISANKIKELSVPQLNNSILGRQEKVGVTPDSQRVPPCINSLLEGNGCANGEPAKKSENSTSHSSQVVIAVYADKRSVPQVSESQNLRSFTTSPRKKLYEEVACAPTSEGILEKSRAVPGSSWAVGDDTKFTVQDRSSSEAFKSSSSRKHLMKKNGDRVVVPDVIDLTVSQGDSYATSLNTISAEQHCVINVDQEKRVTTDLSSRGQDAPIVLSSSPIESRPPSVLHPIFTRQVPKKRKDKDISNSRLPMSTSRHIQVPWPGAEDQHNTGPRNSFSTGLSMFGKYRRTPVPVGSPTPSDLRWLNVEGTQPLFSNAYETGVDVSRALTSLEHEAVLSSLPSAHREHPGISRFLDESPGIIAPRVVEDGEMWSQRWRPRRAGEVLGNEENALYLKAWLRALALRARDTSQMGAAGVKSKTADNRGTRRPTVVRAVVKKRGRKRRRLGSEDGDSSAREWIVDDEGVESGNDSDEFLDCASSCAMAGPTASLLHRERQLAVTKDLSSSAAADDSRFPEFPTLTNTILLAGPPGSGKSSAIYACAEELGWEVFEVHPGIGKRSGGSISSLIGDVGKNHHVGRRGAYSTNVKHSSDLSGFGYLANCRKGDETRSEAGKGDIRQSIILLDEVDILFKEDANFWPSLVNIVKFSHRPIFMTCNDASLIPHADLPLQTCLQFKPCPSPLAVSFLQCVSLAEGHFVPREQLEIMYAQTYTPISCDEPEIPSAPYPSQQPPCSDLRQALNNLQFLCSRILPARKVGGDPGGGSEVSTITPGITPSCWTEFFADWTHSPDGYCGDFSEESPSKEHDIRRIAKHADSASYIDGYLERRPCDVLEASAIDRYGPSGDDEMGYTLLDKPTVIGNLRGLAFYNRDADMARTALVVSRHVFETSGAAKGLRGRERGSTRQWDSRSLRRARVARQTLAVTFLDDVMTLSGPLLPRAPVILEYIPYVRHMILMDDVLEAEAAGPVLAAGETRQRRGRPTRTRRVGEYPRYIAVSAEGLEAARNMSLGVNP